MKNIDDPHTNPTFEYSVQRNVLHEKPNTQNFRYRKIRNGLRRALGQDIPNLRDYTFWRIIRRSWIEFTCTHWNALTEWSDGEGWNIVVCKRCHRARIFTDGMRPIKFDQ